MVRVRERCNQGSRERKKFEDVILLALKKKKKEKPTNDMRTYTRDSL